MKYFKKLINIPIVILPGRGRVYDTDLLAGDEYTHFVPMFLYECDERGWPLSAKPNTPTPAPTHTVPHLPAPTHVSAPVRPPPPPALAQAWEERRQQISTSAGLNSLADALLLAEKQTVPVEEPPPAVAEVAPPAAVPESPKLEIPTTMHLNPVDPPKRKRGRPRKYPLPSPPPESSTEEDQ